MKILFIDTVHPFLWKALCADGHLCVEADRFSLSELIPHLKDAEGIVIRSRFRLDEKTLSYAPELKFIARAGAGMESIDVDYAGKRGIACLNSPEGNRNAVGEHALGMLLSLFNNLNKADREVRKGQWIREGNRGHEIGGKTIGLIGYGNMGSAFAKKLEGFDCKILAYDKYKNGFGTAFVNEATMDELFSRCDVLSLHIPLTEETSEFVCETFIEKFKKPFYILNTARGKCVVLRDLVQNMKSGKIIGAGLDVLEYEDLSFEKFSFENAGLENDADWNYLISSDQVILSPHIAGWTFESHEKISKVLYEKISTFARQWAMKEGR